MPGMRLPAPAPSGSNSDMAPDTMVESSSNNGTGDGSGANSAVRANITELEREFREESDRLIVEARQEVEKCRRDYSGLQNRVVRLEEDCDRLREREAKDQERIKSLVEEIEAKERDFQKKFIEMKVEIWDLECGKRRAVMEVEQCRRDCSGLQDRVVRLEEDCDRLREWEAKDQERIKSLVEEIEAKERDFQEKFIEMKVEIRDLECGKNQAVAEVEKCWRDCSGLQYRVVRLEEDCDRLGEKNWAVADVVEWRKRCEKLVEEVSRLKGRGMVVAGAVDEEMPLRNEGHLSTSERKRSSEFMGIGNESESMGEDGCDGGPDENERILLRWLKKRRVTEAGDGAGKDSGCGEACEVENVEPTGTGYDEPVGTSAEVVAA